MMTVSSVLFSSKDQTWATPQDFFDQVNKIFKFDFDVCASEKNKKCAVYFDEKTDALKQDWRGTAWCNPPYNQNKDFIKKALDSAEQCLTVMLIPNRTGAKYFHEAFGKSLLSVHLIRGRLKFGDGKSAAPFASMLLVFGKNTPQNIEKICYLDALHPGFVRFKGKI